LESGVTLGFREQSGVIPSPEAFLAEQITFGYTPLMTSPD